MERAWWAEWVGCGTKAWLQMAMRSDGQMIAPQAHGLVRTKRQEENPCAVCDGYDYGYGYGYGFTPPDWVLRPFLLPSLD